MYRQHHSSYKAAFFVNGWLYTSIHIVVGRTDFGFFVSFENTATWINKCSVTCWFEPTLTVCLRCRSLCFLWAAWLCCAALCCAVPCCAVLVWGAKKAKKFRKVAQQIVLSSAIITGWEGLRRVTVYFVMAGYTDDVLRSGERSTLSKSIDKDKTKTKQSKWLLERAKHIIHAVIMNAYHAKARWHRLCA